VFILIGPLSISLRELDNWVRYRKNTGALSYVFVKPDVTTWFHGTPTVAVRKYRTRSGLILNVPVVQNKCWKAPLPCTPNPAANLKLRQNGRLESGFVTDGDWQPINFPGPLFKWVLPVWRENRLAK